MKKKILLAAFTWHLVGGVRGVKSLTHLYYVLHANKKGGGGPDVKNVYVLNGTPQSFSHKGENSVK